MKRTRLLGLALVTVVLLGAAPPEVEDMVRQGNEAFQNRDYEKALTLYEMAEERATDPGLVAFNKAAALFRLEQYDRAEQCYRRCLEDGDIPGPRRARALYALGNCLLQLGDKSKDVATLAEAIRRYDECRRHADADRLLRGDAEYNLELARLLWIEALAEAEKNKSDTKQRPEDRDPSPRTPEDERKQQQGDLSQKQGQRDGQDKAMMEHPSEGEEAPTNSQHKRPGRGNERQLPDDAELEPLDPRTAEEHLLREVQRIANEQRRYRQTMTREMLKVKDW